MNGAPADDAPRLLAVDLGLRLGLACFRAPLEGRAPALLWYRSQHLANVGVLKAAIPKILDDAQPLATLVVEGDRHLGDLFARLAEKRGARVHRVSPERWRQALLLSRQQRSGKDAKFAAHEVAKEAIDAGAAPKPKTPLNDDVAEAICIGVYGLSLQ